MKATQVILSAIFILTTVACSPSTYFQVFKATPQEKIEVSEDKLVYEDDNCIVTYNLWSNGGNIGFKLYNKTNENLYLNVEESFFVLNGIANNYYKNRVYTNSVSTAAESSSSGYFSNLTKGIGVMKAKETSVAYTEEKIVVIPPKASKFITEYIINEVVLRDCNLVRYPSAKHAASKAYKKEDSPLVFSNRINYRVGSAAIATRFENEFYISEITNYPEKAMYEYSYDEFCGKKSASKVKHFKYDGPDKFYLKYTKGTDTSKY